MVDFRDAFVFNGFIYTLFFGGLGSFALCQIMLCFFGYKDKTNRHFRRKFWFHVVLCPFGFFESIYAISLILNDGYSTWGLVFHLVALYLHVLLFALIINFWKLSLIDFSPHAGFGIFILALNGIVTLAVIVAVVLLNVEDFAASPYNLFYIIVNSFTMLVMSSSLLLYGYNMKSNLAASSALLSRPMSQSASNNSTSISLCEDKVNLKIKLKMLARINNILIIVLACYALRVLSLVFLSVEYLIGGAPMTLTAWLICSWLIPSVPILVYLNIMQMTPNNSNRSTRAFKFFEDDSITDSAMIDDEKVYSEEWATSGSKNDRMSGISVSTATTTADAAAGV